ncbi:FIST signal transduction protein [Maribellus mangrovi]|uniref:FIST signal transduction protein n=1 Tax=Maribellus mangrovi TaxID=3133146 RepID=UPI0030EF005A
MKAKAIKGKSSEEIKVELLNCTKDDFQPTLAIVFPSISQDRESICELLDANGISIFGATTNGEFINDERDADSTAIILLDINPQYFTLFFDEFQHGNYSEVAESIANKSLEKFQNPAFLVAGSNFNTDAEEIISGLENVLGKEANIFGGMAGDNYSFTDQFVFTNKRSSNNGILTLVLDENKIQIKGRATHGWKAVGTPKTVTKSEGNHVYMVDDIPVLDLTRKYGGLDELKVGSAGSVEELAAIAANFPLQLQREKGAPVMRPGLRIDWQDGSFYCGGKVPQGSQVRFSLPPDFDVIEKVVDGLKELKENEIPEADAVIVFSCAGRQMSLGPMIDDEIKGIYEVWNAPMAGFFSNGEIARATDGNNDLHNLTACCVVLKEK